MWSVWCCWCETIYDYIWPQTNSQMNTIVGSLCFQLDAARSGPLLRRHGLLVAPPLHRRAYKGGCSVALELLRLGELGLLALLALRLLGGEALRLARRAHALDSALQPLELRVCMLEPLLRRLGAEVDHLAERTRCRALEALQQLHEGATRPWALESARDGADLVAKLLVHPSGHVDGHRARSVGLEQRGERHVQR